MRRLLNTSFPILLLVLFSCEKNDIVHYSAQQGGIVITFDDKAVCDWYVADSILNRYHWKATFCISQIYECSINEIQKIRYLQNVGHEIAGHGLHHIDATKFVASNGIFDYLDYEIIPMMEIMNKYDLYISSFAYPYGSRNVEIDEALFDYFKILRGTTYGRKKPSQHNCYFSKSRIVFGIGIDKHHEHFSENYILKLLSHAKNNKEILIVYCHKPTEIVTSKYQIEIATLELICKYIEDNDMIYYTLSDLYDML